MNVGDRAGQRDELAATGDADQGAANERSVMNEWVAALRTANTDAVTEAVRSVMRGMGGRAGGWSVAGTEHGPAFGHEPELENDEVGEGDHVDIAVPRRRRFAEGTGTMRAVTGAAVDPAAMFARGSSRDLRADIEPPVEFPEGTLIDGALDLDLDIADGVGLELDGGEGAGELEDADEQPVESRKRVRRRTKRNRPRSKTIAMKRVTRAELQAGALLYPPVEGVDRPRTRAECKEEQRPCPWVSCKHHLYLDINPETGSIKINFPDLEPWEMTHTCSLDVADEGALTLEEIGVITNLTRERIRQLEVRGLLKLKGRRELR